MKAVAKKKQSRASICRRYKITAPTLAQWELEGVDIHSDEQMQERNARKHGGTNGAEMAAYRLQKLKAEAQSATLKAAQLEGTLIALDEVEQAFTKIGTVTKSLMIRMQADLPPALEGQTASRMATIISEAVEIVLRSMSDPEGMVWREK